MRAVAKRTAQDDDGDATIVAGANAGDAQRTRQRRAKAKGRRRREESTRMNEESREEGAEGATAAGLYPISRALRSVALVRVSKYSTRPELGSHPSPSSRFFPSGASPLHLPWHPWHHAWEQPRHPRCGHSGGH